MPVAAALLALVATTGCAADATSADRGASSLVPLSQIAPVADPRALEGPSTATLADRAIEPVAESPAQVLPSTVVSRHRGGDREVVVESADRVLAVDLSGSIAATVWGLGLGDRLVGRDVSTTFPGVEDLPVVTSGGHSINAESVLDVRPDVVITDGSIGPRDVVEQLSDAGVTVLFVDNDPSFRGAQRLARDVAAALGVPAQGDALADQIGSELAAVTDQIDRLAPTRADQQISMLFVYLRGSGGVYYLLGRDSGAGELIEALGGVDLAAELGWGEAQPMTDEALVLANPDLILVMSDGLESVGGIDQLLEDKPSVALTAAGQHRRFVDMADGDVLSFGPRSADVLAALARAVYAPNRTAA